MLKPIWVSSEFNHIKNDKQREWVTRNHLEKFWGLRNVQVEWYTLERIDNTNKPKMISREKACEWLKNNMLKNNAFYGRLERIKIIDGIIDNFRKAMEE